MRNWPRITALAMLLLAMALLIFFQWLPALWLLPGTGALLIWNQTAHKPTYQADARPPRHH